jgi:hypothetical protein
MSMTKSDSEITTHIAFLLDKSGSMASLRSAVIDGYNQLMSEQRALRSPCFVTQVQFDDEYEEVYIERPLSEVPLLTAQEYEPRGGTALLDALSRFITALSTKMDAIPLEDRVNHRVIVVVHTDGAENSSRETTLAQLQARVKEQQEEGRWLFVFAAANIDAFAAGQSAGIHTASVASFQGSAIGTHALFSSTSAAVLRSRSVSHEGYAGLVRGAESFYSPQEMNAMANPDGSVNVAVSPSYAGAVASALGASQTPPRPFIAPQTPAPRPRRRGAK